MLVRLLGRLDLFALITVAEPVPLLASFKAVESGLASLASLQLRGAVTSSRSTIGTSVGRKVKDPLFDNRDGSLCLGLNLATLRGRLLGGGDSFLRRDRLQSGWSSLRPLSLAIHSQIGRLKQTQAAEVEGFPINILFTASTYLFKFLSSEPNATVVRFQACQETGGKGAARQ